MIIKSNTAGKLNKMINGTVFSNEFIFVKEFLQNAQRAKASSVVIDIDDSFIRFRDNGKGCKKASNIFTLDLSEWESTNEGFGIGFWSCLALKDLVRLNIRSFNWSADVALEDILKGNLEVDLEKDLEIFEGFEVVLTTNHLDEFKKDKIKEEVKAVAQYLDFDTICNNVLIDKIDIFSNVSGDFVKMIETRDFKARISISDFDYKSVKLFYDKREVCSLYNFGYIKGIIEPKKGKINLKEPDRTSYIYDDKYYDLRDKVEKEVKKLYMEFLKSNPSQLSINKYSDAINHHLEVKDYEKYMDFKFIVDDFGKTIDKESNSTIDTEYMPFTKDLDSHHGSFEQASFESQHQDDIHEFENTVAPGQESFFIDEHISDLTESTSSECALTGHTSNDEVLTSEKKFSDKEAVISGSTTMGNTIIRNIKEDFVMNDYVVHNHNRRTDSSKEDRVRKDKQKNNKTKEFKDYMRNKNKIAWVLKEDVDTYSEEIAQAEYAKIKVIKVENVLYANIFEKHNKMHISEFKHCFKETFTFKNIQLKNAKEERVIQNLAPICEKYNLPLNTFVIGNIEVNSKLEHNGKVLFTEKSKNTKDGIKTYAVEDNGLIILDRTALNLSRFKLPKTGPFGINDLKCVFGIINTIAHELAHLLYQTKDNTVNHYTIETLIQKEITELYI